MRAEAGKTFVITGASSGIGREIALRLAAPGREIWIVGRDQGRLAGVAEKLREKGSEPHVVVLDLADLDAAGRFLEDRFPGGGGVANVYLVAGVSLFGEVRDTLAEDWDRVYRTNLLSPIQWTRHFYEGMVAAGSGRLVIVSSLAAYAGYPTATAYATMKAGLLGLYRSLWHEARAHGVDIHLASPGYVDTGIYRSATFRNTSYDHTMQMIRRLGFKVLTAESSAVRIIRAVEAGKHEFAFPAYASVLRWMAPRVPGFISLLHQKMIRTFRETA